MNKYEQIRMTFRVLPGQRIGDVVRLPPSHVLRERAQYHERRARYFDKMARMALELELQASIRMTHK